MSRQAHTVALVLYICAVNSFYMQILNSILKSGSVSLYTKLVLNGLIFMDCFYCVFMYILKLEWLSVD